MTNPLPYWRLSGFYFFYFASIGAFLPYWSLYLQAKGFDARAIGELMAIIMATKIVAPYLWGWIADHTGKGMLIIRAACVACVVSYLGVFVDSSFWWLALVMTVFSFFWNAELPQFEVNTINHLGADTHKYSGIRLWGSLGFIFAVIGLGALLEHADMILVPQVLVGLYVLIALSSFLVPEKNGHVQVHEGGGIVKVLRQPVVIALLVVCFLGQMSHGPYYTFYSIYLKQHAYNSGTIGWLWALGVMAEVLVFMAMYRLMPRFGPRKLLMLAMLLTSLRWYLIGHFIELFPVVLFAQVLHAASFGLYHAVSIELFHRLFRGRHQGRGQALYSSISFGAGGAVGSYLSGQFWDSSSPLVIFNMAALAALVGFVVSWRFIRLPSQQVA